MTDDEQLTALFEAMCHAWTDGDAEAYGSCFTDDSDYVSFDGSRTRGKAAMVRAHDKLFRGVLYGSALVGSIESIRHLRPDVALLHGTGSVLVAWRSRLPKRRLTRNTLVAVRTDQGWRFAAIHNGRVRPMPIPEPDSSLARAVHAMVRGARSLGLDRQHAQAIARSRVPITRSDPKRPKEPDEMISAIEQD